MVATAAVGWGLSAAGWLISPLLTRFFTQCFDALGINQSTKFQSRKKQLFEKLEILETTLLPQLLILADAAQHSPHRLALDKWLHNLKSAFYEAEHVLGLVDYKRLQKEVDSLFPPPPSILNFKCFNCKLPKVSCAEKNLIKSLEKLEKVVSEAIKFVPLILPGSNLNTSNCISNEQHTETISTLCPTVIGRDKDRDHIVKLLRENFSESTSNAPCYSVIGIWGMGGSGKTTLARYVYKHEKKAKHFDRVIWVHVSEKFSIQNIWKRIWESAFKETCPDFSGLEGLHSKLKEKLRNQMFFLVLDDVWCDKGVSEDELQQLFAPLRAGKRGSKILVTTRIEEAAKALGAVNPILLPELDEDHFFLLFISNALGNAQIRDNRLNNKLTLIGKEIAAKLCRSPLAAKAVAGQLRRRIDTEFWSSMLNKSLLKDTMGALFLSYQHLCPQLQRCFALCSLFPKGHSFGHVELINLWIAEGFIETDNSNEHMNDIANGYILDLISCFFFQVNKSDSNTYSMHDLIYDLAQHVSQGECLRIESGEAKEIPPRTRHICVVLDMLEEYMERICKLKYLCTILVHTSLSNFCLKKVDLDALFMKSKRLRVVVVQAAIVERVPKSVVHLRNLRYLSLVTSLPDGLHNSLNRLYQLRFLYVGSQIPYIGRLTMLQGMTEYRVKTASGFELRQLEHLRYLFGSLSIYGLHHVENREEAHRAKLSVKKGLRKLQLSWDYEREDVLRDIDSEILDELCPPPQIKELVIKGYSGKRFPSWIVENNGNFIHLEHLQLVDCKGLEALQRLNTLSNLLSLTISCLPRLRSWASLSMDLLQLEISHCLSLSFILKEDLEKIMSIRSEQISKVVAFVDNSLSNNSYTSVDFQFQHVQEMMKLGDHIDDSTDSTISTDLKKCLEKKLDLICHLKNVNDKLSLPPKLEKLSIKSCFITENILTGSLQGLTSLTHLILQDIITITSITKEVLASLKNLMVLDISGCLLLMSIGGWDTHNTLEEFYIDCCPNLMLETSIVADKRGKCGPSTLKKVIFSACKLSDDLQGLVSLETLWVCDCQTIVNLQIGDLKSLVDLVVRRCPNLVSLRGLGKLRNLKYLDVLGCQKIECSLDDDKMLSPNKLFISRLSLVTGLISRKGLSSLASLDVHDEQQENFSQEEREMLRYLSSLREIVFYRCKMHSLPTLLYLDSLRSLSIFYCTNLTSLPDLPPSVELLSMRGCNEEFTRSCTDTSHQNCHRISHVPDKHIRL